MIDALNKLFQGEPVYIGDPSEIMGYIVIVALVVFYRSARSWERPRDTYSRGGGLRPYDGSREAIEARAEASRKRMREAARTEARTLGYDPKELEPLHEEDKKRFGFE